ncbi:MAG: hypothetical protein OEZ36_08305 [Spirochaetota bacterium]|nr:hypothetical protein [Spirochaetota bacterium]
MLSTAYKEISPVTKPVKLCEEFSQRDYQALTRALREVICENYERIMKNTHFSEEELYRLQKVKSRRRFETHYRRFGQSHSHSELSSRYLATVKS